MMNSKDALNRIKVVLGLTNYSFATYKNQDGVEFMCEGALELDKDIYVVTPEGNLPAPDGEFDMVDGTKVSIQDGKVKTISYAEEKVEIEAEEEEKEVEVEAGEEKDEVEMAEATLVDGIIVSNDEAEFAVGQDLFIVTEEGKSAAPDGEHETTDGKIIVVVDGKITEIKEKPEEVVEEEAVEVEASTDEVSIEEIVSTFSLALEALTQELETIKNDNKVLADKFSKFSAEPAGDRVYTNKSFKAEVKAHKLDALETLRKIRAGK
jgi:hypothetical protein